MNKQDFRWRNYLPITAVLLIVLLLPVYSFSAPLSGAEARQKAPDFTLSDINNNSVSLSDHEGAVRIMMFWATW